MKTNYILQYYYDKDSGWEYKGEYKSLKSLFKAIDRAIKDWRKYNKLNPEADSIKIEKVKFRYEKELTINSIHNIKNPYKK